MSDAKTSAAESGRVVLTAASLITAIMIERLVGRLGELSDGQVLWGSTSGVLVQGTFVLVMIVNWWGFYATVTSVGRWILSPLDLLALGTIAFLGGVLVSRTVVAGMKRGAPPGAGPFDSYPARWIELLFVGTAMTLGTTCLLRFSATPHPVVLNSLILLAAAQDAVIVVLQLRWWSRITRAA